jgi:hypothetical protein
MGSRSREEVATSSPVALITGALTGIGRATPWPSPREGARVVVSGRHDDEGQKLATELRNLGTEAEFVRTDVRHDEEVKSLVDETIARFGRLAIAVNNAGAAGNPESAADTNAENYKAIFDTNVLGVLLESMRFTFERDPETNKTHPPRGCKSELYAAQLEDLGPASVPSSWADPLDFFSLHDDLPRRAIQASSCSR